MRALVAIAIVALGFAGIAPAHAGDLSAPWSSDTSWFIGERAEPVVTIDDQPGVVVRDYWLSPWHNHHYFPLTGRRPRFGRRENLAARTRYRPAESFYREWSNSFVREVPLPPCVPSWHTRCAVPNLN